MKKLILLLVVLALMAGATQTVLAQPEQSAQTQSAYIKAGKFFAQGNVGYMVAVHLLPLAPVSPSCHK